MRSSLTQLKEWQIAEAIEQSMKPIGQLTREMGLEHGEILPVGHRLAKVDFKKVLAGLGDRPTAKIHRRGRRDRPHPGPVTTRPTPPVFLITLPCTPQAWAVIIPSLARSIIRSQAWLPRSSTVSRWPPRCGRN